ncbi:hypothetical protein VF04_38130 [Nostoc linckia z7]|uniref:Uncharacterized protein n=2 Tax=Nostoc linckia TaxID=92942 RepID=A0ABX4KBH7_NOSLI|nr:hypothetical protein [Nostoc linckia]PHJ59290.1 hypothetical protein VF05_32370 [Nostoc linckia z3]PHJ63685.1 hypothetical protein VF03_30245 [Nostoc linckia z2]PHJ73853.1 hypothetical protein VF06_35645 [Nostoc linckia z4]PHJ79761.1 hypothetical protein VF04_38130 [Nostoc linckia z7]PHJ51301.1 hypothetical protein VF02_37950 [Nostoc linckia z1]
MLEQQKPRGNKHIKVCAVELCKNSTFIRSLIRLSGFLQGFSLFTKIQDSYKHVISYHMAKAAKKKEPKKRAEKYEDKVTFEGTFEDMIGISVKDAEKKSDAKKSENKKDS